jgi:hypothetical protein
MAAISSSIRGLMLRYQDADVVAGGDVAAIEDELGYVRIRGVD